MAKNTGRGSRRSWVGWRAGVFLERRRAGGKLTLAQVDARIADDEEFLEEIRNVVLPSIEKTLRESRALTADLKRRGVLDRDGRWIGR